METLDIALTSVAVVFAVDLFLVVVILVWKPLHRRHRQSRRARRARYVAVLGRYLALPPQGRHSTPLGPAYSLQPITEDMAMDEAFLDAIIDLRNTVAGPDVEILGLIASRFGLVERQARKLARPFPLGSRLRASVSLAEMGDESSSQILLRHLDDREPEIRIQAARGLGRMKYVPAIEAITARLESETPWVRARFADTLLGFGGKATGPLLRYVRLHQHADNVAGVVQALRVLGLIGDHYSGPALSSVLDEAENTEVRLAAISALGWIGVPLVIPSLQQSLLSPDWRLRAKTATAMGDIGDPTVIPDLSGRLEDRNWWVRRNSASALARLPGGVDALYEALMNSPDPYAQDAAAEALFDVGDVTQARHHRTEGIATRAELRLLDYMRDEALTA